MATIENLGAAYSLRIARQSAAQEGPPFVRRAEIRREEAGPTARRVTEIRHKEEAQNSQDSLAGRSRAIEKQTGQIARMTLEELAEMLRKVNLTFDLFEIQAKFTVDRSTGDITVEIINQRTGEVIRRIPPYDLPGVAEALKAGEPAVTDVTA
jgi:uncharacterized FlaG/YvyC family protein